MKDLIIEYRFVIVVLIAILLFALLEWQKFKAIVHGIMLQAKSMAKDLVLKSGVEQENWVVMQCFRYLPKWITVFISQDNMYKIVHYLYHKAKDYLDDGRINNSIE
jgi:hypothetical protein